MGINKTKSYENVDFLKMKKEIDSTGFACIDNPFGLDNLAQITDEAKIQYTKSKRVVAEGIIAYKARMSDLGECAIELLKSETMSEFLQLVFDDYYDYNPNSSCYTYYGKGDYLSAHKDCEGCDVTVLIYVDAAIKEYAKESSGMYLEIYEENDSNPGDLLKSIRTDVGLVVVGKGSCFFHGRRPLNDGERMGMVSACFNTTSC